MAYTKAGRVGPKVFAGGRAGESASVYIFGTTTLATLYTSAAKSVEADNPVTLTDSRLSFYADPGTYEVRIGQNRTKVEVHPDASEHRPTDTPGVIGDAPYDGDTLAEIAAKLADLEEATATPAAAAEVTYDNTTSELTAEDVQAALDELAASGTSVPVHHTTAQGVFQTEDEAQTNLLADVDGSVGLSDEAAFDDSGNGVWWRANGADGDQVLEVQVGPSGDGFVYRFLPDGTVTRNSDPWPSAASGTLARLSAFISDVTTIATGGGLTAVGLWTEDSTEGTSGVNVDGVTFNLEPGVYIANVLIGLAGSSDATEAYVKIDGADAPYAQNAGPTSMVTDKPLDRSWLIRYSAWFVTTSGSVTVKVALANGTTDDSVNNGGVEFIRVGA